MDLIFYRLIDNMLQKYKEKGFSKAQIKELRKGIESDLDISKYDDINLSSEEMFDIRWKLTFEKYEEGNEDYERKKLSRNTIKTL
ncbi:hypothetical protein JYG23_00015 [Sedimentibacter sp. zth1]|uniref:hypothetical protein n=1 Tax=Sedimentibacter sp. zth1 TaxID=2816908 RepID=UPI001A93631B|nr:hypothetical protein [Sedimentibacter sp. zth1]QSX05895.1 hypothetical protein JYG23_00015 [Sedimentibacter sp. zth1]